MADSRINALTEATSLDDTDWFVAEVGDSEARKVSVETLGEALPGSEIDYVQITSPVTISGTTDAAADTCITGTSLAYDGSTRICIEVYSPSVITGTTSNSEILTTLWDGATDLGRLDYLGRGDGTRAAFGGMFARVFLTPTAASHQYIVKAFRQAANGTWGAGAGGTTVNVAAYLRITKA